MNAGNSSKEEQLESGENAEESVIHDITGTTVYVVGVICVIPAAGLVAWVVRYVVKKKVMNQILDSVLFFLFKMKIYKDQESYNIDYFIGSLWKLRFRKLF